jgi:signal peptidase complex subunit 3
MNTLLSRTNAIFAFTLSVLAALTLICALSTTFKAYNTSVKDVKMSTTKKLVKNVADYSAGRERNDLGFISFNLEADFAPAFDWNTKQLFLYMTAHYKTRANVLNQVVLWDHIIQRGRRQWPQSQRQHHTHAVHECDPQRRTAAHIDRPVHPFLLLSQRIHH